MRQLPRSRRTFHITKGDGKGAGAPPLGGIIGRKAGATLFSYSKAMKNSGITWSDKHLFMYILNPGKHIPGNKMSFAGITGETERAHLIAFLSSV
jgi:cytochrome c